MGLREHVPRADALRRMGEWSLAKPVLGVLLGLILVVTLGLTVLRLARISVEFSSPLEITFGESVNVRIARDYRNGVPIYRDWQHERPYIFAPYGPLFYALPAWIAALTGGDDVERFQRIGRSVSLAASVAALALIAWMLRSRGVAWPFIVLDCLMIVSAEITWPVQMMFRPDAMEVCWMLAGFATASALWRTRWRALALGPFLIAGLFKQSAIVAPMVLVLYVLWSEGIRAAVRFAVLVLALYGCAAWLLSHVTSGLYYENTVETLRGNVTWSNPLGIVQSVITGDPAIAILAIAAIAGFARRFDLLVVYLLFGALFAAFGTLRDGSGTNYFLTVMVVATIVGTEELAHWTGFARWAERGARMAGIGGLLSLLVAQSVRLRGELPTMPSLAHALEQKQEEQMKQRLGLESLVRTLDALEGPILCNNNDVNLHVRHPMMFELLTYGGLADQGRFDDAAVMSMIRGHDLGAVVLDVPIAAPLPHYQSTAWVREEWIQAIRDGGYSETATFNGDRWYYVYKPRPTTGGETASLPPTGDLGVELSVEAIVGRTMFTVTLQPEAGGELGDVQGVRLRASFDDPHAPGMAGDPGIDLELRNFPRTSVWTASSGLLTGARDCRAEITIRRRGMGDVTKQVDLLGVGRIGADAARSP